MAIAFAFVIAFLAAMTGMGFLGIFAATFFAFFLVTIFQNLDKLLFKLKTNLYDWGSGALAVHVLHGLYVLAEKTTRFADKTKKMIESLESRKNCDFSESDVESDTYPCKGCGAEFRSFEEFYTHLINCDDYQKMQNRKTRERMKIIDYTERMFDVSPPTYTFNQSGIKVVKDSKEAQIKGEMILKEEKKKEKNE